MRLSGSKKTLFSIVILLCFITFSELLSRLMMPDIQQTPVIVERVVHSEIRYDWLDSDPILFWKLAGNNGLVFRVEEMTPEQSEAFCLSVLSSGKEDLQPEKLNYIGLNTTLQSKKSSGGQRPSGAPMPRLSVLFDRYVMKSVATKPEPDTRRIAAIGDSCTFFGHPSWPKLLETFLNCSAPKPSWEVINAGVPAYSSHQGLKLLEHYILDYQPDIVTVYFGWNDHWLGLHGSDADHDHHQSSTSFQPLDSFTRHFKMFDAFRLMTNRLTHSLIKNNHRPFRVDPDSYRTNLKNMVALAEQKGFSIVFITAPHGFEAENPPEYLHEMGYFDDLSILVETHAMYNDIVRQTAISTGSILVDAASAFETLSNRRELFLSDGIHLTDKGIQTMAKLIYQELISSSIIDMRVE